MKQSILTAAAIRKAFVIAALAGASFVANASIITVSTDKWSSVAAPSSGKLSNEDVWIRTEINTPTKSGNSSGALISDFKLIGDFSFSGIFSPTFASNSSCERHNTCNDNDIIGLVFGWQDVDNHYRLGWNQGGKGAVSDVTGRDGLFLIKETGGRSNTLVHFDSTFWVDEAVYEFSISRTNDSLAIVIEGATQDILGSQSGALPQIPAVKSRSSAPADIVEFSVTDSTFTSGNLGVYTESQTGFFNSLAVQGTVDVSAPAFSLGFILLGLLSMRRKSD